MSNVIFFIAVVIAYGFGFIMGYTLNRQEKASGCEKTKENGTYEIKVPPGKYYVMAHEFIRGGRPRPGSSIGMYGKTAPSNVAIPSNAMGGLGGNMPPGIAAQSRSGVEAIPIEGKHGEVLENIDITMFNIPDPEKTRKKIEEEARARKESSELLDKTEPVKQPSPRLKP